MEGPTRASQLSKKPPSLQGGVSQKSNMPKEGLPKEAGLRKKFSVWLWAYDKAQQVHPFIGQIAQQEWWPYVTRGNVQDHPQQQYIY